MLVLHDYCNELLLLVMEAWFAPMPKFNFFIYCGLIHKCAVLDRNNNIFNHAILRIGIRIVCRLKIRPENAGYRLPKNCLKRSPQVFYQSIRGVSGFAIDEFNQYTALVQCHIADVVFKFSFDIVLCQF